MTRFIFKALIFFFPLFVLLAVTEYKARQLPSDFAVKRERLEQNIDRAEIIVAGSSHAYYAVKPALLGVPAVTIAYPGQDLYYDSRILLKYLPQANRAKLVIVTVSYLSLEYMMEDSEGKSQTNFYYKYWGIPHRSSAFNIANYSRVFLFGLQRSRDFLITGKPPRPENIDESGGNADLRSSNDFDVMNGQIAVKRHEAGMNLKYVAQNSEYLDELFDAVRRQNISAVIVTTPCFHTYYDNINPEKYLRMQNAIQTLSQKYNLKYYNYLKDERFVAEDFADSDHLSTPGAEKFSRILKDEVIGKYISTP